jgi:hypothetical protein
LFGKLLVALIQPEVERALAEFDHFAVIFQRFGGDLGGNSLVEVGLTLVLGTGDGRQAEHNGKDERGSDRKRHDSRLPKS